jgi:signal peptidase I
MSKSFSYTEKVARKKFFMMLLFIFALTVLLYHLISAFIFRTYRIETDTMQPTFESGQMLGAVTLFNTENLRRGDLVFRSAIYKDELNIFQKLVNKICSLFTAKLVRPFGNEQRSLTHGAVFRIVGLPGDTIYMNNFIAYIKNAESDNFLTEFELSKQNYDIKTLQLPEGWKNYMPFSGSTEKFILGEHEFFLLSDNRVSTFDSRLSGICTASNIEAKILFVLLPFKSWKKF